ncbi:MAG: asparaginase [Dehalococcoidia bacterium]
MPVLVQVTRGSRVESVHSGTIVIAGPDSAIRAVGDPRLVIFPRSSLKPFQAVPLVALGGLERFGLDDEALALICASHTAGERHLAVVAKILAAIDAPESAFRCPPGLPGRVAGGRRPGDTRPPSAIAHQCSGKHAGMLALAALLGAPFDGYLRLDHPVQRTIRRSLEVLFGPGALRAVATDGCNAPAYAVPLETLARGFGLLGRPAGQLAGALERIGQAMRSHPTLISGDEGFLDTALMETTPGLVAKRGAEGVFAAGLADGRGLAIKVRDGDPTGRAVGSAVVTALADLGALDGAALAPNVAAFGPVVHLHDLAGEPIGSVRPASALVRLGRSLAAG